MKEFLHNLDKSAVLTLVGIILLFSCAVGVILIAPSYVDPTWTAPTCSYQVQMYEVSDPNLYIGSTLTGGSDLQFVYHLKKDFTLLAFQESPQLRIVAPEALKKYVTGIDDPQLKLTSRLLMVRQPVEKWAVTAADKLRQENPKTNGEILELYEPGGTKRLPRPLWIAC